MTSESISIKVKVPNSQMVTNIAEMLKELAIILEQINQAVLKSPELSELSEKIETIIKEQTILQSFPPVVTIQKSRGDDLLKLAKAIGNLTAAFTGLKQSMNISKNSFN